MKSFLYTFILLFAFNFSYSQIVDIPDAEFKSMLVNYNDSGVVIDTNSDGEIQVTEAELITELNFPSSPNISSLEGLEGFINLIELYIRTLSDNYGILVIENLPNLEIIRLYEANYTGVSFVNLPSLNFFRASGNQNENFTSIDFSNCNCINFETLLLSGEIWITSLDVSNLVNLKEIQIVDAYDLTTLDITNNVNLEVFNLTRVDIDELDFSNNPNLLRLRAYYLLLREIDVTNCPNLYKIEIISAIPDSFDLSQNPNLTTLYLFQFYTEYLNLKNGNTPGVFNLTNITADYICADEDEIELVESFSLQGNPVINSYCSFGLGGEFFIIEGENRVDDNTNGCDAGDNFYPSLKFNITDGTNSGTFIADNSGNYNIPVSEGTHTMTPVLEYPDYFNVAPSSTTISFPAEGSPYTQDFCITPNGVHNDVEVFIVPTTAAIPGFDSDYKIVYRNKGNTTLSGIINLDFDDDYMDFLSANPTEAIEGLGNLQWNYTNLQPFETREIGVVFNLNTPTDPNFPLNSEDILELDVNITPYLNDETQDDNSFGLKQTVVNSFDPNDKTCLEGTTIRPEHVGKNVHYVIRFENLGTANAVNVVVKDVIDISKYDISTLIPIDASHAFKTRIIGTNNVEFIFENINLPFDDANNDGYIVFKIETLSTLQLGDTFENDAEIFFDFNAPIITNTYSTAVQDNLGVDDFETSEFRVYPNPAKDYITIASRSNIDIVNIIDVNGRLIKTYSSVTQDFENQLDVSALTSGLYFMELKSGVNRKNLKFIKE